MRKFASTAALGTLALALAACGGSGSALDGSTTATGGSSTGGTTGGGTTGKTPTYQMGNGSGTSFQSGQIGLSSASLSAGGTDSLSVTVVDQTGTLYAGQQVTVSFNSACIANGLASIAASGGSTPGSTAGTVNTTTGNASRSTRQRVAADRMLSTRPRRSRAPI